MGLFTNNPNKTTKNIQYPDSQERAFNAAVVSVANHRLYVNSDAVKRLEEVCGQHYDKFEEARASFDEYYMQPVAVTSYTVESAREQVEAARINNDTKQKNKSEVFIDKEGNFSDDTFDEGALIVPPEWTHKPAASSDQYDQNKKWDLAA